MTALYRQLSALAILVFLPGMFFAAPSVFPTGTTIYHPDKAWSGYTLHDTPDEQGAVLVDMNGTVVKHWTSVDAVPSPFRMLPGGYVMGGKTPRRPYQEATSLVQIDWDGNVVWEYDGLEQVETENGSTVWATRLHHDWQREGSPAGYYAPGAEPQVGEGRTLILAHKNVFNVEITDKRLEDDYIIEIAWDGTIEWE